jgi:non-heme Fe2+,alpha-ketoglutarate-dependent halogenase
MTISQQETRAAAFERDGFLARIRVRDEAGAASVRAAFDGLEAAEGREKCQIGLVDRHFDQQFVWEVATDPAILAAVGEVLGPDVLLLATHFFCKYPAAGDGMTAPGGGTGTTRRGPEPPAPERFVAWHQDVTYWGLEPPAAVTAWYAVDDSDVENGCMRVIPGTHRGGIRRHGTSARAGNLLSINQEVPVSADEAAAAVDLVLRAGEISLHHGMLIHGSNPNRSVRRRCGMTIRYVPAGVRQVALNSQGRGYRALIVRGSDPGGHWDPIPRPFPLRGVHRGDAEGRRGAEEQGSRGAEGQGR